MGVGVVLHIEWCRGIGWSHDATAGLPSPINIARPAFEESAHGCVGIAVTTQEQNLAAHILQFQVFTEAYKEVFQVVFAQQRQQSVGIVAAIRLVALISMKQVNDGKLGGVGHE